MIDPNSQLMLGPITAGTSVHDTGVTFVTKSGNQIPGGTVIYRFFTNGTCTGSPQSQQTVTIASGVVPVSTSTGALSAGAYSYQAVYSGDSNYTSSTGDCEPITVNPAVAPAPVGLVTMVTQVIDDATGGPPGGLPTGASVHDTGVTMVVKQGGTIPGGTVTYLFFTNDTCSGTAKSQQTVTIRGGVVPNSASTGPLAAGQYGYQAIYSGDAIYAATVSDCEQIGIG